MKLKQLIIVSLIAFCLISTCQNLSAQTTTIAVVDSTSQKEKRLIFGVGFGLNFVGGTNISLSPNLMYKVSNKFTFGAGVQGSYSAIKDLQNTTTIGGNVVTQYNPIPQILTLVEFVELNVSTETESPEGKMKQTYWDSALFVGAGYSITPKIAIGAKYNLLYNEDESVYSSPVIPFVNITF